MPNNGKTPPPPPNLDVKTRPESLKIPDYDKKSGNLISISIPELNRFGDLLRVIEIFYPHLNPQDQTAVSLAKGVYLAAVKRLEVNKGKMSSDIKTEKQANRLLLEVFKMMSSQSPWSDEQVQKLGDKLQNYLEREKVL